MKLKIQGQRDELDGVHLYWSNQDGWVDFESATAFDLSELDSIFMPNEATGIALLDGDGEVVSVRGVQRRYLNEKRG